MIGGIYLDGMVNVPTGQMLDSWEEEVTQYYTVDTRDGPFEMFYRDDEAGYIRFPRSAEKFVDFMRNQQCSGRDLEVTWKLNPREGQQAVVDQATNLLKHQGNAMVVAGCGCLTGDTTIQLNRAGKGFRSSLLKAYLKHSGVGGMGPAWDPSIKTYIRGDVGDRIGLIEVEDIVYSGPKEVFLLTTDSGKSLKMTACHPVLCSDGNYRSLDSGLVQFGSVAVESTRKPGGRSKKVAYKRLAWDYGHPFAHLNGLRDGKSRYCLEEHRAVAEAALNSLSLEDYRNRWRSGDTAGFRLIDPSCEHVHHLDGDIQNNDLSNLQVLSVQEHRKTHGFDNVSNLGRGVLSFERIRSVQKSGIEETYDVCCKKHHNFVANEIVVHNSGKTVMGSAIGLGLGVSACIIVHKEFLAQQWEDALKMLCPGVKIGRMQRDQCDSGNDFDFVIATTQSITNPKREYPAEFYRSFGLVIADEVHRYAAEVWQRAITKFPAANRLALTATPYRSDGLWPVIEEHFGTNRVTLTAPTLVPLIHKISTNVYFKLNAPYLTDVQRRGKLVTQLTEVEGRNEIISRNVLKAFKANRKILVISERKKQLEWLGDRLRANDIEDFGFYVGGKKMDALNKAAQKRVVFTTYQMAKEGLDIPDLDVLIMASPQAQIEQTVGRILRFHKNKGIPVVLDFVDPKVESVSRNRDGESKITTPFDSLWFSRRRQYKKLGYEIAQKGK